MLSIKNSAIQLKEICFNNNDQTNEGIPYLSIKDISNLNYLNEVINNLRIHKKEINFDKLYKYFCNI